MKQAKTSKESIKIYEAIDERLEQLWNKLTSGNYNSATPVAFKIGFIADIDQCLKKLKIKRSLVKQDNVMEIEAKDIEPLLKKLK